MIAFFVVKIYSTKMDYRFRPYTAKDRIPCSAISAPTWRFDFYFPQIDTSRLNNFVFDMLRLHSNYTDIAAKESGEPVGFLFAQIKTTGLLCKIREFGCSASFTVKNAFLWLFGAFGSRSTAHRVFKDYKRIQKILLRSCAYDSEITALFVDAAQQGNGIAKKLLERFYSHCTACAPVLDSSADTVVPTCAPGIVPSGTQSKNTHRTVLITDTDCNYAFYDSQGFALLKKIKGTLGIFAEPTEKSPACQIAKKIPASNTNLCRTHADKAAYIFLYGKQL